MKYIMNTKYVCDFYTIYTHMFWIRKFCWISGNNKQCIFSKMTLHEREEDRLWNGGHYQNLPDLQQLSSENIGDWKGHEASIHPDIGLSQLQQEKGKPFPVPYGPVEGIHFVWQNLLILIQRIL